jgi:hypothetical protein
MTLEPWMADFIIDNNGTLDQLYRNIDDLYDYLAFGEHKDLVNDPQIAHNKTFVEYDHPTEGHIKAPGFPFKFSKSPGSVTKGAPLIGEDTRDVLKTLGYSQEKIEALLTSGNVAGK